MGPSSGAVDPDLRHQFCPLRTLFLDQLVTYCLRNKLSLKILKCKVITFHRRRSAVVFNYSISGVVIPRVQTCSDLGILFDSRMGFRGHIEDVSMSAFRVFGFIIRTCRSFHGTSAISTLYYSLVRSKLEFAALSVVPQGQEASG